MRKRLHRIWQGLCNTNRYVLSSGLFLLWMLTLAEVDIIRIAETRFEKNSIEAEIQRTEATIRSLDDQVAELRDHPEAKERHAREQYYMHKSNEDVYVFR